MKCGQPRRKTWNTFFTAFTNLFFGPLWGIPVPKWLKLWSKYFLNWWFSKNEVQFLDLGISCNLNDMKGKKGNDEDMEKYMKENEKIWKDVRENELKWKEMQWQQTRLTPPKD